MHEAAQQPDAKASRQTLMKALAHKNWLVVAEAAAVIGEHSLSEFAQALDECWPRFVNNGAKVDPGCRAKQATLTALDRLELMDPTPFVRAVRYQQLEPVLGGTEDTAGGVRQRCVFALLRMHFTDALLYAGELMADPNSSVRAGVAGALGHYGTREAAALLLMRIKSGDPDPIVISESCVALMRLVPDLGISMFRTWLSDADDVKRESAALALGQTGSDEAIDVLTDWIDDGLSESDFELSARALGLSRNNKAREALLSCLAHGSIARAEQALHALAVHNYDPKLRSLVQDAVAQRSNVHLRKLAERLFSN